MPAALIQNLRTGQARLDDQLLAEALTRDGLHDEASIVEALTQCEPGRLGTSLIASGALSAADFSRITDEIELATLMDSVGGGVPAEVQSVGDAQDRRIGRYVLVDELGAGGMGVVWRAWDGKLSRWVALKQVKVQEPQLIRRFMQEAKLLAGLNHPNITQVYEVGVHAGKPYLVMELVDGEPPGKAGPLPRKEAASVVRAAAEAVQFAHERGIVHRDLKPSNLLVSREGRVFVTDFGLARMREDGNNLTQTGALLGTPAFMAPEQAQARSADHQTDVYGLGATLYALVAGKPPHSGEIVHEIVKRVAMSNPPTLQGNDDLVVVAQTAMERDREDRYASAGELAADLQRFVDDEPIAARPIHSVERAWRRAKRRPVLSTGVALVALAVGSTTAYGTLRFTDYLEREAQIASAQAPIAEAEAVANEIKRLVQVGQAGGESQQAALRRLDALVAEALTLAPNYAEANFLKGMSALWQADHEAAVSAFTAALDEDPNHLEARARRAVLQLYSEVTSPSVVQDAAGLRVELSELDAATQTRLGEIQAELLQLPSDYPLRRLGDALLHSIRGEFVQQRDALEAYLAEHSYDLKARAMLPWALLGLGDYGGVEREAKFMMDNRVFPNIAQYLRALSLAGRGRYNEAFNQMEQLQAVEPDASHLDWMATWALLSDQPQRALAALNELLDAKPDDTDARLYRGSIALDLGDLELAERDLRTVLAANPTDGYVSFQLAAAVKSNDREQALSLLRQATEDASIAPNAWIRLGFYHLDFDNPKAGLRAFQSAAELTDMPQVNYGLSEAHRMLGQVDLAREVLQPLADDPIALSLVADINIEQGNTAAALEAINRAIELAPTIASFRIEKGRIQLQVGASAAARRTLAAVLDDAGQQAGVYADLIEVWIESGQPDEALQVATQWRRADPTNTAALAAYESLQQPQDSPRR